MMYILFDELGRNLTESYMREIEERIAAVDGVSLENVHMACVNDSMEAAELLAPLDMSKRENWGKIKFVMHSAENEPMGYFPRSFLEEFKTSAVTGKTSYEVFKKILGDEGGNA